MVAYHRFTPYAALQGRTRARVRLLQVQRVPVRTCVRCTGMPMLGMTATYFLSPSWFGGEAQAFTLILGRRSLPGASVARGVCLIAHHHHVLISSPVYMLRAATSSLAVLFFIFDFVFIMVP